tara:strand:+ start:93 stop:341 length:249 start_codon:yes stop_codon:yes gene_type:complete
LGLGVSWFKNRADIIIIYFRINLNIFSKKSIMYKYFTKNPAYKSIGSSETIQKKESQAPEEKKKEEKKKQPSLMFRYNWFAD